jgi:hypothetical protein
MRGGSFFGPRRSRASGRHYIQESRNEATVTDDHPIPAGTLLGS